MSLRVIAGKAKGRKLKSVEGETTRPITDRAKESLFNILGVDVIDSNWWDLFGGTGAVGIEALSRGASFVRFTDLNREPIETIKFNLAHCRFESQAEELLDENMDWLADDGWVIAQIAPKEYQTSTPAVENLEEFDQRQYGSTLLVFYQRKEIE
jgi:16S rRNA G966 N2-methylase RsmD